MTEEFNADEDENDTDEVEEIVEVAPLDDSAMDELMEEMNII